MKMKEVFENQENLQGDDLKAKEYAKLFRSKILNKNTSPMNNITIGNESFNKLRGIHEELIKRDISYIESFDLIKRNCFEREILMKAPISNMSFIILNPIDTDFIAITSDTLINNSLAFTLVIERDNPDMLFFCAGIKGDDKKQEYTYNKIQNSDELQEAFRKTLITAYNAYVALNELVLYDREIITQRVQHINVSKNKKGKNVKKNSKSVIKINNYKISYIPEPDIIREKRTHDIQCECWKVSGHWRYYKKTGKKVWIEGYKKGVKRDSENPRQKEYKMMEA